MLRSDETNSQEPQAPFTASGLRQIKLKLPTGVLGIRAALAPPPTSASSALSFSLSRSLPPSSTLPLLNSATIQIKREESNHQSLSHNQSRVNKSSYSHKPQLLPRYSTSPIPFDAETAKEHVNERAARKIMDLEIANESLLAVNSTLENTIREQALRLKQMRQTIGILKRKYAPTATIATVAESSADYDFFSDFHDSFGDNDSGTLSESCNSIVDDEEFKLNNKIKFINAPFKDGVHIIPQIPENSPEDQKELELRFNRVCATICQLIAEGNKALSNPIQQKKLLVEGTLNAPQILREKHSEKSQQMPYLPIRTESEPIPIKNSLPPTVTLSESSTKLSKVIVHAKLTPMILDDIFPEYPDLSNNLSSVSQSLQQRRRPSPQMLDSIYKKARNLITSRRTFLLHYPTTQQDLDEIDSYIMNNDTVQIPASLYTAFVEVVEGVHEDLVDAQQNNNYYYGDDRISGGGVNWRRDEIVAGGFSISAGKRATAVHVVVGKSGANVSDQAGGDDWTRRKNIVDFTSSAPSSSTLASRASRDESAVTVDRKVVSPTPLPTRRSVSAGGIRRPAAVTPVRSKLGSSGASAKSVVGNRSQRLPTLGSTTVQSYGDGP